MSSNNLPFPLDEYWATGPAALLGERHETPSGKVYRIVKNTDAAALAANELVKWESRTAYTVDKCTAATDGRVAAGRANSAVPVNGMGWIQIAGLATMSFGTAAVDTEVGREIGPDDAAAKGQIGGFSTVPATGDACPAFIELMRDKVGVAWSAVVTGPDTCVCDLQLDR